MLGSVEQGILYCRAFQNGFFIKTQLLRAEDVANFPNTWKQTQRSRQSEEKIIYVLSEGTRQNHSRTSKQKRN